MTSPHPSGPAEAITPAEPTATEAFRALVSPRRGFVFFLVFAAVGAAAVQMSTVLLTLSLRATEISGADAASTISLATGLAGIIALVGLPIVGRMSDRSRSRLGRRRPFLLLGAGALVIGSVVMLLSADAWSLTVANLLITIGAICVGVTTTALIAEQLPSDRRGPASALISLSTPMGALIGIGISQPFGGNTTAIVLLPAVIALVGILLLVIFVRDPQVLQDKGEKGRLLDLVGIFWVNPIRHRDFFLAFTSRMLVFSGVAAINSFQALFLIEQLGFAPQELGTAILLTVVINTGVSLLVAPAMGKLSDRIRRRKPFVVTAAIILGAGLVMASQATDFTMYLVAVAVIAIGQGVYFSVELALATQVLPDPENPAKDLALINVANNLPTSIVAAVAPALLAVGVAGGGHSSNFAALFIAGAVAALLGGLVISFIRTVK